MKLVTKKKEACEQIHIRLKRKGINVSVEKIQGLVDAFFSMRGLYFFIKSKDIYIENFGFFVLKDKRIKRKRKRIDSNIAYNRATRKWSKKKRAQEKLHEERTWEKKNKQIDDNIKKQLEERKMYRDNL